MQTVVLRTAARWLGELCILLLILPLLSGCWDRLEIEERALILGIGIDIAEPEAQKEEPEVTHLPESIPEPQREMIKLTAQIAVPGRIPLGPDTGGGGSEQKPIWVVEAVGHTLDDAMFNLQQKVAEEIFLGHLRIIIIHEEVAKKGIEEFNDYLRRNHEVRRQVWLVVSKDNASKLLGIAPPLQRVPTLYLTSMLESAVAQGKLPNDVINIFWTRYSSKGEESILPYISIKQGENVQIDGLAYFNVDKLVGVTNPLDIGTYMAVKGVKQGGYASFVKVPGTSANVLVRSLNRRTKWAVDLKDGKPHVRVIIHYETELDEKPNPEIQVDDHNTIEKIEKVYSKNVAEAAKKFIEDTQKVGSDIFGFGEYVRAKKPMFWNRQIKTKEHWQEMYKDIIVEVEVSNRIRRTGMKAK